MDGAAGIPVETVYVDLGTGDQKKPEYLKIFPRGQVPGFLDDDGTAVYESAAIVRYLANKHKSQIFPTGDPKAQAKIDQVYEQIRGSSLREVGLIVFHKVFYKFVGVPSDENALKKAEAELAKHLKTYEEIYFHDSPNFVIGTAPTLADCIMGTVLSHSEIVQFDLTPFPKVKSYYEHFKGSSPFKEGLQPFYETLAKFVPQK